MDPQDGSGRSEVWNEDQKSFGGGDDLLYQRSASVRLRGAVDGERGQNICGCYML